MKKILSATIALMLMTGAVTTSLAAPPASAATNKTQLAAPSNKEINTTSFLMNWKNVAKANHYQIQVSTKSNFKNAKTQDRYNHKWSGEVAQNTTYYSRYRAVYKNKNKKTYSSWSKVLKTTTKPKTPLSFTTKVKTTSNSATLTWGKSKYATKYRVVVADNQAVNKNPKITWTTKNTAKVSLNSRDGQVKFLKVTAYNGSKYTHSNILTATAQSPAVAKGENIKVASQNVLCFDCTVKGVKNSDITWAKRSVIHLAEIKAKNPDVLLLQEAWNPNNGLTSFYTNLKNQGYTEAHKNPTYTGGGYSNRVYYKSSKYTQISAGDFSIPGEKRGATWALLKSKSTGKEFYVVSTHLSPFDTPAVRAKSAEVINAQMDKLNTKKKTIIVGGDMNTQPGEAAKTAHTTFIQKGWTDAASAKKAVNKQYSTHNAFTKSNFNPDYNRLDYIYSKNTGGWSTYENVVKVSKGKIVDKHGSDHNMIVGTTTIK